MHVCIEQSSRETHNGIATMHAIFENVTKCGRMTITEFSEAHYDDASCIFEKHFSKLNHRDQSQVSTISCIYTYIHISEAKEWDAQKCCFHLFLASISALGFKL